MVHVAVTSLKGRAFRTEKITPDGLREPSDERQTGKARGDAFTGTGIECVFEDVEVLKVLKHYSIWQKTYREVLKMYDQILFRLIDVPGLPAFLKMLYPVESHILRGNEAAFGHISNMHET